MSDCVFCKIIVWEIPSAKIWEDEDFIAILDAFPSCKWQTLVMPKKHIWSDISIMSDDQYSRFFLAVKQVMILLKKSCRVEKVWVVVEGLAVAHAHIKLYPFRGWKSFEDGFTWTVMADMNKLKIIAEEIKK